MIKLIASFVESKSSLIVEGVHLSLNVLLTVVERFPNVVPFLIYIKKEDFHKQRFAVRAKYMTTDPVQNKYISNFDAIRAVQSSLSAGATEHLIPKIDNRNIDRSLETMHQTLFSYLKKLEGRTSMFDPESKKLTFLDSIWKRRKQKQTSKSKTLKAISQLQIEKDETQAPDAPMTPFEEMMSILPSEKAVFKDVVSGNDISFTPAGTMLLGTDTTKDDKPTPPQTPVPAQPRRSNPSITFVGKHQDYNDDDITAQRCDFGDGESMTETEADPVEITLTDFAETTDFIETTDTEGPDQIFSSQTRLFFTPK